MESDFANIPGKYFAADLETSDLIKFSSDHPTIFWIGLGLVVLIFVIYSGFVLTKRSKKV
jgi:hypothetical protein